MQMSHRLLRPIIVLSLMLWAISSSVGWAERRYVNNSSDLHVHFETHIQRVARLGSALYQAHRELFPGVSHEQVKDFLSVHDRTKVDDSAEFRRQFWTEPTGASFIEKLYSLYGKGYAFLADPANERSKQIIDHLNATDKRVATDYFRRQGMLDASGDPNAQAKILLRIERIADVVDRNSDPVAMEEFNIQKQRPLGDFVRDPIDLALALELKSRYQSTVRGAEFLHGPHSVLHPCKEAALRQAAF